MIDALARRDEIARELGEEITLDGLTGRYRIFQRKRGHRHSIDDVLTAWYASESVDRESTRSVLDLGTGIGTVGLMVLSRLRGDARLVGVEAQEVSARFFRENVRLNELEERVSLHHGDLRELELKERFSLVTGSPPYFDKSAGIVPSDSQKAHARFELRGDVRDYLRAARRHLAERGEFVFCFPFAQKGRAVAAVRSEGFAVVRHRDVVPRATLTPLISLFQVRAEPGAEGDVPSAESALVVRTEAGDVTPEMQAVRASFGFSSSPTRAS